MFLSPFMQLHTSINIISLLFEKSSQIIAASVAYQYLQTIIFTFCSDFLIILGKCIGLKLGSLLLLEAKSLPGYLHLNPLFQILSQVHIFKCLLDISTWVSNDSNLGLPLTLHPIPTNPHLIYCLT